MKIENYHFNKSSFLSVEKDFSIITDKILSNDRIKRLLFYTTKDALHKPALTEEQSIGLMNKNIKLVPKLTIDSSVLAYIVVSFDNFTPNYSNPEFRNNIIAFDIVCHFDQWQLEDFQLRPYRIAAELDEMLDKKRLTGIGLTHFLGASQIVINSEFAGLSLLYEAIHGNDDKINALTPEEEAILFGELP